MRQALAALMSVLFLVCFTASAADNENEKDKTTTQNKNVTIIQGQSTADGKSQMREQILEECIVSLPRVEDLEPEITSESQYLKEINGDPDKNEFVKYYSASLEINYMLYQKVLIVVTTNTVAGQEPVMKVMEKNIKQSKKFISNPSEGDIYAGRSHRRYYYSSAESASNDVKKRAQIWLKEQGAVICKK